MNRLFCILIVSLFFNSSLQAQDALHYWVTGLSHEGQFAGAETGLGITGFVISVGYAVDKEIGARRFNRLKSRAREFQKLTALEGSRPLSKVQAKRLAVLKRALPKQMALLAPGSMFTFLDNKNLVLQNSSAGRVRSWVRGKNFRAKGWAIFWLSGFGYMVYDGVGRVLFVEADEDVESLTPSGLLEDLFDAEAPLDEVEVLVEEEASSPQASEE